MSKETIKIIREWEDDLIWCPSQCYLPIEFKGEKYTVYLRWRHDNPWQGHIWKDKDERNWSPDLLAENQFYYADRELNLAKETIIDLAEKHLNKPLTNN